MIERISGIILLILFSPLFILLIFGYFLAGQTSIIYSQMRIGYLEMPFKLYKFRTLRDNAEESLQQREFPYGRLLRRSSLDELPQLINVIKGEMSLVGPRPLPIYYALLFSNEQRIRFQVKPGVTGLAQINGGTQLSWSEKFSYDLKYVQNHSFWGDILIMLKTVAVILSKKDDGLKEEPFTGNQ